MGNPGEQEYYNAKESTPCRITIRQITGAGTLVPGLSGNGNSAIEFADQDGIAKSGLNVVAADGLGAEALVWDVGHSDIVCLTKSPRCAHETSIPSMISRFQPSPYRIESASANSAVKIIVTISPVGKSQSVNEVLNIDCLIVKSANLRNECEYYFRLRMASLAAKVTSALAAAGERVSVAHC